MLISDLEKSQRERERDNFYVFYVRKEKGMRKTITFIVSFLIMLTIACPIVTDDAGGTEPLEKNKTTK